MSAALDKFKYWVLEMTYAQFDIVIYFHWWHTDILYVIVYCEKTHLELKVLLYTLDIFSRYVNCTVLDNSNLLPPQWLQKSHYDICVWLEVSLIFNLYVSKMLNGLEVITEQLSNSDQPHIAIQGFSNPTREDESKAMYSSDAPGLHLGAPQFFRSCGSIYKNILKIVQLFSKWYKLKLFGCANFRGIGTINHIPKEMLENLEPGAILFGSDCYNVYLNWYKLKTILPLYTMIQTF